MNEKKELISDKSMNLQILKNVEKFYDLKLSRNYWLLGYFGSSFNVVDSYNVAIVFVEQCKCKIESVFIDEIHESSQFKHFKYLWSNEDNQYLCDGAVQIKNNVYNYFRN